MLKLFISVWFFLIVHLFTAVLCPITNINYYYFDLFYDLFLTDDVNFSITFSPSKLYAVDWELKCTKPKPAHLNMGLEFLAFSLYKLISIYHHSNTTSTVESEVKLIPYLKPCGRDQKGKKLE